MSGINNTKYVEHERSLTKLAKLSTRRHLMYADGLRADVNFLA